MLFLKNNIHKNIYRGFITSFIFLIFYNNLYSLIKISSEQKQLLESSLDTNLKEIYKKYSPEIAALIEENIKNISIKDFQNEIEYSYKLNEQKKNYVSEVVKRLDYFYEKKESSDENDQQIIENCYLKLPIKLIEYIYPEVISTRKKNDIYIFYDFKMRRVNSILDNKDYIDPKASNLNATHQLLMKIIDFFHKIIQENNENFFDLNGYKINENGLTLNCEINLLKINILNRNIEDIIKTKEHVELKKKVVEKYKKEFENEMEKIIIMTALDDTIFNKPIDNSKENIIKNNIVEKQAIKSLANVMEINKIESMQADYQKKIEQAKLNDNKVQLSNSESDDNKLDKKEISLSIKNTAMPEKPENNLNDQKKISNAKIDNNPIIKVIIKGIPIPIVFIIIIKLKSKKKKNI